MESVGGNQAERTLTVFCKWGLCNRLGALLSGLVMAEATGRTFTMLWPRNNACSASFGDLFANHWNVVDVKSAPRLPLMGGRFAAVPWRDLLVANEQHLVVHCSSWMIKPQLFPSHAALWPRCVDQFSLLEPVPYVRQQVESFRSDHFRPVMIGAHLRRGDFWQESRDNTRQALAQIDAWLKQWPSAGIFLSTDDGAINQETGNPLRPEGVKERFRQTYGDRVVWTEPRSLDRRQPEAVQDAVVDLLLLRSTDCLVGTRSSTFSGMAAFGRNVPVVRCDSGESHRNRKTLATITGVYPALKVLGFVQFRKNLAFDDLWRYYWSLFRRLRTFLSIEPIRRLSHRIALAVKQRFRRFVSILRSLVHDR